MDWNRLLYERNVWIAHNFPEQKIPEPQESLLGMVEEVGELAHSHLKELQAIRGTPEEHQANAKDAIGDITVYLLGVLNHLGYMPQRTGKQHFINRLATPQGCIFLAAKAIGSIGDFPDSRMNQGRIDRLYTALDAYCRHRDWNYEEIVTETWERVSKRDWIVDPVAGGE